MQSPPAGVQTAAGPARSANGSTPNGKSAKPRICVVVVGARKTLRTAIEQRLAEDFDVDPIQRGDDLIGSLDHADAVVVVDIARRWSLPTRYASTLRAIASVLIRRKPRVVVCLTCGPGGALQRRLYLSRCDAAEVE